MAVLILQAGMHREEPRSARGRDLRKPAGYSAGHEDLAMRSSHYEAPDWNMRLFRVAAIAPPGNVRRQRQRCPAQAPKTARGLMCGAPAKRMRLLVTVDLIARQMPKRTALLTSRLAFDGETCRPTRRVRDSRKTRHQPDLVHTLMLALPLRHFLGFSKAVASRCAGRPAVAPELLLNAGLDAAFCAASPCSCASR